MMPSEPSSSSPGPPSPAPQAAPATSNTPIAPAPATPPPAPMSSNPNRAEGGAPVAQEVPQAFRVPSAPDVMVISDAGCAPATAASRKPPSAAMQAATFLPRGKRPAYPASNDLQAASRILHYMEQSLYRDGHAYDHLHFTARQVSRGEKDLKSQDEDDSMLLRQLDAARLQYIRTLREVCDDLHVVIQMCRNFEDRAAGFAHYLEGITHSGIPAEQLPADPNLSGEHHEPASPEQPVGEQPVAPAADPPQ